MSKGALHAGPLLLLSATADLGPRGQGERGSAVPPRHRAVGDALRGRPPGSEGSRSYLPGLIARPNKGLPLKSVHCRQVGLSKVLCRNPSV
jgi:hypothetical protein